MWGCSREIPKLNIQSAMSCVIQRDSSSPGLPAGTAPEARGRGAALVSGAVDLPPPPRRTNGRPAVPPPRCHSRSPRSRAPPPAELPPRLRAERAAPEPVCGGRREGAGGGAWGFLGTPAAARGLTSTPTHTHTHHRPPSASMTLGRGWGRMLSGVRCV